MSKKNSMPVRESNSYPGVDRTGRPLPSNTTTTLERANDVRLYDIEGSTTSTARLIPGGKLEASPFKNSAGVVLASNEILDVFHPRDHGSTFA